MGDDACVRFLQQTLPELHLRWPGLRKVRRQVCRRIRRRWGDLGLEGWEAYRKFLLTHPEERRVLDTLCRVTLSRFRRDRGVWQILARDVLPALAAAASPRRLAAWSAGCASGEEPYTLTLLWHLELAPRFPGVGLEVVASDADLHLLARARRAVYPPGCLRELPRKWVDEAFTPAAGELRLRRRFREGVRFLAQDLRQSMPAERFHLVLCRNLAFTYFAAGLQMEILARLAARLVPGGVLVIGAHEALPAGARGLRAWPGEQRLFERIDER